MTDDSSSSSEESEYSLDYSSEAFYCSGSEHKFCADVSFLGEFVLETFWEIIFGSAANTTVFGRFTGLYF